MKLTLAKPGQGGHSMSRPHYHLMHSIDFGTMETFRSKCARDFSLPPRKFWKDVEVDYPITAEALARAARLPVNALVCGRCVQSTNIREEIRRAERKR